MCVEHPENINFQIKARSLCIAARQRPTCREQILTREMLPDSLGRECAEVSDLCG